jgi:FKBP-type peptidyl-prolyl cis-trans isomerase FkpA
MKSISLAVLLAVISSSAAFAQTNVTEGFLKTPHGLYYKIVMDAHKPKAKVSDIVKMNLIFSNQRDSVLFSSYEENMGPVQLQVQAPSFNGDPMEGYAMLGAGDSAIFLMPADSAYKNSPWPPFAKKGEFIKITVAIVSTMTKADYDSQKMAEAQKQTDMDSKTIEDYLAKNNLKAQKTASGIYYIITQQGTGNKAEAGKMVTVNYTGKLLDGKVFESSLDPGHEPYTFRLGAGNVIKGWDEGLTLFNEGGKGTLFIPSALGYGSRPNGPIPANSILIFDIELLAVK